MNKTDAYNAWLARLNEIKDTPAESNGYVNADTARDHYWIDNNGTIERFHFNFDRCPSCDESLEVVLTANGDTARFCHKCFEVYR